MEQDLNVYDHTLYQKSKVTMTMQMQSENDNNWKPQLREQTGMVSFKNKLYIYGGLGNDILEDIV